MDESTVDPAVSKELPSPASVNNTAVGQRIRTEDVTASAGSFQELLLPPSLVRGLDAAGFVRPSPVQRAAIPLGRLGADLIVQAKSGTGKTAVFAIVCLERVKLEQNTLQALILAPTREVAIQNEQVIAKIASELPQPAPTCSVFVGGLSAINDEKRLRRLCHIAVGTPGRVCSLVQSGALPTDDIAMFVLDEADSLLAESFYPDVTWLYDQLPRRKQVMAFSATYTDELLADLEPLLKKPQRIMLSTDDVSLLGVRQYYSLIQDGGGPADGAEGHHHNASTSGAVDGGNGNGDNGVGAASMGVLAAKVDALLKLLSSLSFHQAAVFCNLKTHAEWLATRLSAAGYPAAYLGADKPQANRMEAMAAVRGFKLRVLVSTDVLSRGVDLERVNLVVNLDVPYDAATYVHRVGRTGRFGTHGIAVALVTPAELEKLSGFLVEAAGGEILPLPDTVPEDWYAYDLSSAEEQAALEKLRNAPVSKVPAPLLPPVGSNKIKHKGERRVGQQADMPEGTASTVTAEAPGKEPEETPEEAAVRAAAWAAYYAATYGVGSAACHGPGSQLANADGSAPAAGDAGLHLQPPQPHDGLAHAQCLAQHLPHGHLHHQKLHPAVPLEHQPPHAGQHDQQLYHHPEHPHGHRHRHQHPHKAHKHPHQHMGEGGSCSPGPGHSLAPHEKDSRRGGSHRHHGGTHPGHQAPPCGSSLGPACSPHHRGGHHRQGLPPCSPGGPPHYTIRGAQYQGPGQLQYPAPAWGPCHAAHPAPEPHEPLIQGHGSDPWYSPPPPHTPPLCSGYSCFAPYPGAKPGSGLGVALAYGGAVNCGPPLPTAPYMNGWPHAPVPQYLYAPPPQAHMPSIPGPPPHFAPVGPPAYLGPPPAAGPLHQCTAGAPPLYHGPPPHHFGHGPGLVYSCSAMPPGMHHLSSSYQGRKHRARSHHGRPARSGPDGCTYHSHHLGCLEDGLGCLPGQALRCHHAAHNTCHHCMPHHRGCRHHGEGHNHNRCCHHRCGHRHGHLPHNHGRHRHGVRAAGTHPDSGPYSWVTAPQPLDHTQQPLWQWQAQQHDCKCSSSSLSSSNSSSSGSSSASSSDGTSLTQSELLHDQAPATRIVTGPSRMPPAHGDGDAEGDTSEDSKGLVPGDEGLDAHASRLLQGLKAELMQHTRPDGCKAAQAADAEPPVPPEPCVGAAPLPAAHSCIPAQAYGSNPSRPGAGWGAAPQEAPARLWSKAPGHQHGHEWQSCICPQCILTRFHTEHGVWQSSYTAWRAEYAAWRQHQQQ